MRRAIQTILLGAAIGLLFLVTPQPGQSAFQDGVKLPKSIFIQGEAMGQQQQLGRMVSINLTINEFSTAEDQKALLDAFNAKKNEGLVNALSKMKSKGRIAITGTLGYDVNYIKKFEMPDGSTKIRLVTDRPISFGEAWSDSRSMDYNLSGMELILAPDKKKNSGILAPACQFKLDKENHIELELLQNEWKMVNVRQR
jgi:hypothetical protein